MVSVKPMVGGAGAHIGAGIKADDLCRQLAALGGMAERGADQAKTDDGDLVRTS